MKCIAGPQRGGHSCGAARLASAGVHAIRRSRDLLSRTGGAAGSYRVHVRQEQFHGGAEGTKLIPNGNRRPC